ncbi:MAG TPA: hypothetical protein VLF94_04490, partial [Chlamydiales bacterium]|nr:hypothetical protein [Chlamydiales bacterium]
MSTVAVFLLSLFTTLAVYGEIYTARDLGTLAMDRSEARSLNENGWVIGKCFQGKTVSDFFWTSKSGLQILTNEADKEIFPQINNLGNVVGFLLKPGSWLSSDQLQTYTFSLSKGFQLQGTKSRDDGVTLLLNDRVMIICDHLNIFESTYNFLFKGEEMARLFPPFGDLKTYPAALNNVSQILTSVESPGIFHTSLLANHLLQIFDLTTGESTEIASDQPYRGCALNDSGVVIAQDKKGREGFYGSKELGMQSLGDFIPTALNGNGDIVGKRGKNVLLRTSDGAMMDLNKET